MIRRPADPEEELRWMSQEVRGYVEAVLNSLAANVPKVGFYSQMPLSFLNFFLFCRSLFANLYFLSDINIFNACSG